MSMMDSYVYHVPPNPAIPPDEYVPGGEDVMGPVLLLSEVT